MLRVPYGSGSIISIVGIDPGSDTLGTAILWVDLSLMRIVSSSAKTFRGEKLLPNDSWTESLYGNRLARIWALENELVHLFDHVQPFMIASEAPFVNKRFPQAGLALTEVVCAVKNAVIRYDRWKPLSMIDPPTVKRSVNAKVMGGEKGKEEMKRAVLELTDLHYAGDTPLESLDEHSVDALAVAYGRWHSFLKEMDCVENL